MAFESDLIRVNSFVGGKIIQRPASAPGPSAQCSPIVKATRLSFVAKTDDALRQTGAVIGLNRGWNEAGIAPTSRENLLLPRRSSWYIRRRRGRPASGRKHETQFHD